MTYQQPPAALAALVDTKPDPFMLFGPGRNRILVADRPPNPTIEELRQEKLRLAGRKINPNNFTPAGARGLRRPVIRYLAEDRLVPLTGLPEDAQLRYLTWSPRGRRIACCLVTDTGLQVWATATDGTEFSPRGAADLNNSLGGAPFDFVGDDHLLIKRRLADRERPEPPAAVLGPNVQVTGGKKAANRTYTNLLETKYDVDLFRYYAEGQLWRYDLTTDREQPWAKPGIIAGVADSPNGNYFIGTYVREPFPFTVPYEKFADEVVLMDRDGNELEQLVERPAAENLPPPFDSVIPHRRRFQWRSDRPATIVWTQALDGGDPRESAPFREQLWQYDAPFDAPPRPLIQLPLRYGGLRWGNGDTALVIDWQWSNRRQVMRRFSPDRPEEGLTTLFDLNWEDEYKDPGNFVAVSRPTGHSVLLTRDGGNTLLLSGAGHRPEGSRPFIDAYDLTTSETRRLWESTPPYFERPLFFLDEAPEWFLLAREQKEERPN